MSTLIGAGLQWIDEVCIRRKVAEKMFHFHGKDYSSSFGVQSWNSVTGIARATVTVLTWNVEYASDPHLNTRVDSIQHVVDVIDSVGADVVLLQEVPLFDSHQDGRNIARELCVKLGMNGVIQPECIDFKGSRTGTVLGNMILSRFPISNVRTLWLQDYVDWTTSRWETRVCHRNALFATINGVEYCSTHLEIFCTPSQRVAQVEKILSVLGEVPTVVGGDFNAIFLPFEKLWGKFEEFGFQDHHTSGATVNYVIQGRIDGLLTRGLDVVKNSYFILDVPKNVSDHKPVMISLEKFR